jgi:hypothetical protein
MCYTFKNTNGEGGRTSLMVRRWVMDNAVQFESYLTIRAGLVQLTRFVRAIEQQVGRDAHLAVRPDYDLWITELEYALQIYCERCGRQLNYDLIGIEAYATKSGTCLCRPCYDTVTRNRDIAWIGYRGARLAAHGATHPDLLAGVLARAMERRKCADWALEHELGVDESGLLRLALSSRPRPDHIGEDIALLIAATGCREAALRRILDEEREAESEVTLVSAPVSNDTSDEQLPF